MGIFAAIGLWAAIETNQNAGTVPFLGALLSSGLSASIAFVLVYLGTNLQTNTALLALALTVVRCATSVLDAILLIAFVHHKKFIMWLHVILAFVIPPFYVLLCYKGWQWCQNYHSTGVNQPFVGGGGSGSGDGGKNRNSTPAVYSQPPNYTQPQQYNAYTVQPTNYQQPYQQQPQYQQQYQPNQQPSAPPPPQAGYQPGYQGGYGTN